jgi:hypothetical protein
LRSRRPGKSGFEDRKDTLIVRRLGIEFAKIRTAEDAVAFVQQFGLPNTAYSSDKSNLRGVRGRPIERLTQRIDEILESAKELRVLVQIGKDVQHASSRRHYRSVITGAMR